MKFSQQIDKYRVEVSAGSHLRLGEMDPINRAKAQIIINAAQIKPFNNISENHVKKLLENSGAVLEKNGLSVLGGDKKIIVMKIFIVLTCMMANGGRYLLKTTLID